MPDFPPFTIHTWHAASTLALVGLIWVVQLAIYHLFSMVHMDGVHRDGVHRHSFCAYHEAYCARIAWVVAPLMLTELLSAIGLLWLDPGPFQRAELWWGLGAIGGVWLSTAALSVPAHRKLLNGFEERAYRALVLTNWLRTALWTARGIWVCYALDR